MAPVPARLHGYYGDAKTSSACLAVTPAALRWVRTDGRVEDRAIDVVSTLVRYDDGARSIELEKRLPSSTAEIRVEADGARHVAVARHTRPGPSSAGVPYGGRWDGLTLERAPLVLAARDDLALATVAGEELVVRAAPSLSFRLGIEGGEIRIGEGRLLDVRLPAARAVPGHTLLKARLGEVPGLAPPWLAAMRGLPPIGVRVGDGRFLHLWSPSVQGATGDRLLQFLTPPGSTRRARLDYTPTLALPFAEGAVTFAFPAGDPSRPASLRTEYREAGRHLRVMQPTGVLAVLLAVPGRTDGAVLHLEFPFGESRPDVPDAFSAIFGDAAPAGPPPPHPDLIPDEVRAFVAGIELFVDP